MSSATPGRRGVPNGNTVINSAGTSLLGGVLSGMATCPGHCIYPHPIVVIDGRDADVKWQMTISGADPGGRS